jgi:hypothetical protein
MTEKKQKARESNDSRHTQSRQKILSHYSYALSIILLLLGITLRLLHTAFHKEGLVWVVLGELGTFLALIVSIHFIYDIFLKKEERQVLIAQMREEMEESLKYFLSDSKAFHLSGLTAYFEKLHIQGLTDDFKRAKEINILHTWTGTGTQLDDALRVAIKNGCHVKVLLLDPDSSFCIERGKDLHLNEPDDVRQEVIRELGRFKAIADKISGPGEIEIRTYNATPTIPLYICDETMYFGQMWRGEGTFSAGTPYFKVKEKLYEADAERTTIFGALIKQHFSDLWNSDNTKPFASNQHTAALTSVS